MPLVLKDRVQETTTAPGTGTATLLGAVTGFQTFSSAIGNTNTTYYTIADQGGPNFEVGIGTVGAGTLSRDTVLESSNAGSLVDFSSGTQVVFCTYPAEKSINLDASGNATALGVPVSATLTNATGLPLATGVTGTLPTANGGTGLTSFTSGGAVYATSTSALTTGTLPVSSGGTGLASLTANYIPYGNGTSPFGNSSAFTYNGVYVAAPAHVATSAIASSSAAGAYSYGTLGYSDTNIAASYATDVNSYTQVIIENKSNGTAASADYIVSNNLGTATSFYGDFGMNSSNFTGTSKLNAANTVYVYAVNTPLAIGTIDSNQVHFVTNSNAIDAMTLDPSNAVAFNGSFGTSGQVLTSAGTSAPPTWTTPTAPTKAQAIAYAMTLGF